MIDEDNDELIKLKGDLEVCDFLECFYFRSF